MDSTAQQTVLKANPNWKWPTPQFKTVILRAVPDPSSRLEAVRSGAADGTVDLSPQQYASLSKVASVYSDPNAQLIYLGMNFKIAPWSLPQNDYLRRAVATALPYSAMLGGPLAGAAVRMQGITPPVYAGAATFPQPGTNIEKAKALLAQAHFPNGQGLDKYSDGLTLYYSQAHEAIVGSLVNQIRTGLAQIGVNIQIQSVPQATYQSQGLLGGQFPMMIFVGNPGNYPLASASAAIFFAGNGVADFTKYANPKVDNLIGQANSAATTSAYLTATRAMQKEMWSDLPVIPIAQLKNQIVFKKGYSGWEDYSVAVFPYFAVLESS